MSIHIAAAHFTVRSQEPCIYPGRIPHLIMLCGQQDRVIFRNRINQGFIRQCGIAEYASRLLGQNIGMLVIVDAVLDPAAVIVVLDHIFHRVFFCRDRLFIFGDLRIHDDFHIRVIKESFPYFRIRKILDLKRLRDVFLVFFVFRFFCFWFLFGIFIFGLVREIFIFILRFFLIRFSVFKFFLEFFFGIFFGQEFKDFARFYTVRIIFCQRGKRRQLKDHQQCHQKCQDSVCVVFH